MSNEEQVLSMEPNRLIKASSADNNMPSSLHFNSSAPPAGLAECRICHEEEDIAHLESPCACSGSVKFAHHKCVQRWCNEKGDTICEICHQAYQSGYTVSAPPSHNEGITIDFSEEWDIHASAPFELRNPRILAMAAAQRHMLGAEYSNGSEENSSNAACCRSVALILVFLLLMRHALAMVVETGDDENSMYFTLFMLRTAGFLLPCYIMIRTTNVLQRRREEQEAAMAAAEVAMLLQARQGVRGMQFTLLQGPPANHDLV